MRRPNVIHAVFVARAIVAGILLGIFAPLIAATITH